MSDARRSPVRVLVLGGVDPCGGAGITADARMLQARGGLALAVPVCLTVQSRHGMVGSKPIDQALLAAMVSAVGDDGDVHAVKVGLLGDEATVAIVAELVAPLRERGVPVVVDPVLSATAGGWSATRELADAYRRCLLPQTTVLTPNRPELEALAKLGGPDGLRALGCEAVLVKGGHGDGAMIDDVLFGPAGELVLRHPRLEVGSVHGTGCALASALAHALGAGASLEAAAREAVDIVTRCLQATPGSRDGKPVPLIVV